MFSYSLSPWILRAALWSIYEHFTYVIQRSYMICKEKRGSGFDSRAHALSIISHQILSIFFVHWNRIFFFYFAMANLWVVSASAKPNWYLPWEQWEAVRQIGAENPQRLSVNCNRVAYMDVSHLILGASRWVVLSSLFAKEETDSGRLNVMKQHSL